MRDAPSGSCGARARQPSDHDGEFTASLAHELNQPIAAAVTDATTCLSWLNRNHPNTQEACEAASRIVTDATCAAEIISRIRLLFKKAPEPMLY
ncbi:MAG TPA: histidine kinase dimerization/phospho-acceptor domain-containing protein [Candidatus Acidoferrum sp.]|nr:histidine kinase dimerization/phospho-acceptor domain-containing protein [Candidatus Acidoferrum sp.]